MIVHLTHSKAPRYIKPFKRGYKSLRVEDAARVSALLQNLLGQSPSAISMKMNGTRGINEYEEATIKEIFRSYEVDAFTGERLINQQ